MARRVRRRLRPDELAEMAIGDRRARLRYLSEEAMGGGSQAYRAEMLAELDRLRAGPDLRHLEAIERFRRAIWPEE